VGLTPTPLATSHIDARDLGMYKYTHACICSHTHTHTHIYIYTYVYVYIYISMNLDVGIDRYIDRYIQAAGVLAQVGRCGAHAYATCYVARRSAGPR